MTSTESLDAEILQFMDAAHAGRAALRRDPYPFLRRLREAGPVHRTAGGSWLVTGYAAADELLREDAWLREEPRAEESYSLAERVFRRSIAFRDPPVHTRLRRAAAPLFTPRAVRERRERVMQMARGLLEARRDAATFDFREFAFQLPVLVIGEVLGLPADEVTDFDAWAKTLLHLGELGEPTAEDLARADEAARTALGYFDGVIADRTAHPGDDVISRLLLPDPDGQHRLTVEEVVGMCILLHIGGHATTTDLITTGLFHLLQDRDAYRRLRQDPGLAPSAVEEFLRFDAPIIVALPRTAPERMTLACQVVETGERVYAVLGAANRDPAVFHDPDRFDIARNDSRHMAFARGVHFCLGAHLARLETEAVLRVLVTEFPDLHLAVDPDEVRWMDSFIHRGTLALPVAWDRD